MSLSLGFVAAVGIVGVLLYENYRTSVAERRWREARELGDRCRAHAHEHEGLWLTAVEPAQVELEPELRGTELEELFALPAFDPETRR